MGLVRIITRELRRDRRGDVVHLRQTEYHARDSSNSAPNVDTEDIDRPKTVQLSPRADHHGEAPA